MNASTRSSELFGHEKGAFTGADVQKQGLFRAAATGTLFLDEIGNCDMELQAAFLRVLQYGEILPMGSQKPETVDVRIIAATNADLQSRIDGDTFRADLVDRFRIVLRVPPLRDRGDDRMLLARRFLRESIMTERGIEVADFSREAEELILTYTWPGNVRELENRVQQAVLIAPTGVDNWQVEAAHLAIAPQVSRQRSGDNPPGDASASTLADIVLKNLLQTGEPVLDTLHDLDSPRSLALHYVIEQIEAALRAYLETDRGHTVLRSKSNRAILAERFNLPERADKRKKSFAQFLRRRLNSVLEEYRDNLAPGAQRRR